MSIDHAARTEELARDLMRLPKWDIALELARERMRDARDFGVPALHRRRQEIADEVASAARDREAADTAGREERRRERVKAEAERRLKAAMKEAAT